jgi:uncharacterized protein (DUF934 family)
MIVTDEGFRPDDWTGPSLTLGPTDDPDLADLSAGLIRVTFGAFNDGRGFTIARRLRSRGFAGRLRAAGPVIADQYTMIRRAGFDEVEIPDALAARQPEDQWRRRAVWGAHDYQRRLKAG